MNYATSDGPSDEQITEFLKTHEGGGTLEEVASVWGITRERVRQLEARALEKLARQLRWRNIYRTADVIPTDGFNSAWRTE